MSRATALPTRGTDPAPRALRPVLALADRLRASLRLVVLVAVLLVPGVFATWSFAGLIGEQVAFAESERAGVRVVRPALAALAATVAGEPTDLGDLSAAVRAHPELAADEALEAVTSAAAAPEAGTPAGRAATAAAIAALVTRVGDSSKLILDPDLDSFYVMDAQVVQLPKALVAAAQAAAPATGSLQERLAAQAVLAGTISGAGGSLGGDVTTAVANTAQEGLQDRLAPVAAAGEAGQAFAGSLTEDLARPGPADPAAVAALTTAAAAAVAPVTDSLDGLLAARGATLSARRDVTLAVSVLGLLAAGWFAAAVWWRTRHDVGLTVHGVTAISRGDLEPYPLPEGRDEFGNIGRALAAARDQLRAQATALQEAQAERELQVEHGLEQQRVASEHVRSRAQSVIDETATLVAGELAEVVGQVGDVRQTAGTIEERVGAADAATRSVVDQASRATQVVADLGASLQRVASMAQLIGGVADQTKLLALNATIEAARAGEAGRGFSVVADEVKNLAMTTARSTDEITATIGSLEREAQAMAFAITSMTEAIGEVDQATGVLGDVAARQHSLVDRLDTCVNDALNRVQDMSRLTERL